MTVIDILINTAIVFIVLRIIVGWLQQMPEPTGPEISAENPNMVFLSVEQHQGALYAFTVDSGAFVAQGIDRGELKENLNARYPAQNFIVVETDSDSTHQRLMGE